MLIAILAALAFARALHDASDLPDFLTMGRHMDSSFEEGPTMTIISITFIPA